MLARQSQRGVSQTPLEPQVYLQPFHYLTLNSSTPALSGTLSNFGRDMLGGMLTNGSVCGKSHLAHQTNYVGKASHAPRLSQRARTVSASQICCSSGGCRSCKGRASCSIHAASSHFTTSRRSALSPSLAPRQQPAVAGQRSKKGVVATHALSDYAGLLFFAPGLGALAYGYIVGKGNVMDGLSRLLTLVSQVGL